MFTKVENKMLFQIAEKAGFLNVDFTDVEKLASLVGLELQLPDNHPIVVDAAVRLQDPDVMKAGAMRLEITLEQVYGLRFSIVDALRVESQP